MTFILPELKFKNNSLEPFMDEETVIIHHTKHHQTYTDKLNASLEKYPEYYEKPIEELLTNLATLPEEIRTGIRNFGGGYHNHNLFWNFIKPDGKKSATGNLLEAINKKFTSFEKFKEEFSQKAATLFGSGWTWLVKNKENELEIVNTFNQDSPLSIGLTPLLCIDVWEHAYYLKYKNKRADFIEAWWKLVDWEESEKKFNQ